MGCEIERKFLVRDSSWRAAATGKIKIVQGYAETSGSIGTIRVRIIDDRTARLTLKGKAHGIARSEFEYPIPLPDAQAMLEEFCGTARVEKVRYFVPDSDNLVWDIDEFTGANAGLVVAEIELPAPDTPVPRPQWLGEEVTENPRFGNGELSRRPYSTWPKEDN